MSTEFVDKYGNMLRTLSANEIEALIVEEARAVPNNDCARLIADLLIGSMLLYQEPAPGVTKVEQAVRVLGRMMNGDPLRKHLVALSQAWILRGMVEQSGSKALDKVLDRQIAKLREGLERGEVGVRVARSDIG